MGESRVVIAVEGMSLADVEACLQGCFGAAFPSSSEPQLGGLAVAVEDVRETNAYAQAFLKERGLEDSSAAWRRYPSESFPIDVNIEARFGSIGQGVLEVLGECVSLELSRQLSTRTILSVAGGAVAFAVYDRGVRIETFDDECRAHFSSSNWIPAFLT